MIMGNYVRSFVINFTSQVDRCNLLSAQLRITNVMASTFFLWSIQEALVVNLVGAGVDDICWRALGSGRKKAKETVWNKVEFLSISECEPNITLRHVESDFTGKDWVMMWNDSKKRSETINGNNDVYYVACSVTSTLRASISFLWKAFSRSSF